MSDTREVIVAGPAAGFANHVTAGPHELTADHPTDDGGTDTGPAPFELLAAALGACTSMTVSMYARSRSIPLEHVRVTLRHEAIKAEPGQRRNRITRVVELTGPLTDEQRAKLLEIANKCPVHRALSEGVDVTTTLGAATAP